MLDDPYAMVPLPKVREMVRRARAEAAAEERAACARIVLNGGDGQDRLETAIRLGPNAAIAEAIMARGGPTP